MLQKSVGHDVETAAAPDVCCDLPDRAVRIRMTTPMSQNNERFFHPTIRCRNETVYLSQAAINVN
jgi:hypothetical protein